MAEGETKKSESGWSRLVSELISIVPKDLRDMVGMMIGIYAFVLVPVLMLGGAGFVGKYFQHASEDAKPCWSVQAVGDRAIKINACTGETKDISMASVPIVAASAPGK